MYTSKYQNKVNKCSDSHFTNTPNTAAATAAHKLQRMEEEEEALAATTAANRARARRAKRTSSAQLAATATRTTSAQLASARVEAAATRSPRELAKEHAARGKRTPLALHGDPAGRRHGMSHHGTARGVATRHGTQTLAKKTTSVQLGAHANRQQKAGGWAIKFRKALARGTPLVTTTMRTIRGSAHGKKHGKTHGTARVEEDGKAHEKTDVGPTPRAMKLVQEALAHERLVAHRAQAKLSSLEVCVHMYMYMYIYIYIYTYV